MLKWYQITLAFDSQSLGGMQNGRYEHMVQYARERQMSFELLNQQRDFIMKRPDGLSWNDDLSTVATRLTLGLPLMPTLFYCP